MIILQIKPTRIGNLVGKLLTGETRRLKFELDEIMEIHESKGGSSSFTYGGHFFNKDIYVRSNESPHPTLLPRCRQFLMDATVLSDDYSNICQNLAIVLSNAKDKQYWRDALPDLYVPLYEIANIMINVPERTRPVAFPILDNPKKLKAWNKSLQKMEYYSGIRFLY